MIATRERRRAPRAYFNEQIMVRTETGELFQSRGHDVSESGMLLSALVGDLPKKEHNLWLTFTLPRVPKVVQVGARVVRHERSTGEPALGVRFTEIPPVIRRMMRTYVFTGYGMVRNYQA